MTEWHNLVWNPNVTNEKENSRYEDRIQPNKFSAGFRVKISCLRLNVSKCCQNVEGIWLGSGFCVFFVFFVFLVRWLFQGHDDASRFWTCAVVVMLQLPLHIVSHVFCSSDPDPSGAGGEWAGLQNQNQQDFLWPMPTATFSLAKRIHF